MGTATVQVSGVDAGRWAADLHAALVAGGGPGDRASPVQVQRSAELAVAVIGLVFAGIGTAKTMWDWWQSRKPQGATVTVLFGDGTQVDISTASDRAELEIVFQRADTHQ